MLPYYAVQWRCGAEGDELLAAADMFMRVCSPACYSYMIPPSLAPSASEAPLQAGRGPPRELVLPPRACS